MSIHFDVERTFQASKQQAYRDGTKGTTGKGEYLYTYSITSSGNDSVIKLDGEIKGLTGLAKLFGKMMAGTFSKACAKDLDALKDYLENR